MRLLVVPAALAAVLAIVPAWAAQSSAELGLQLTPCTEGHSKVRAECGTFGVYEDRASRSGRIISLRLVILKAAHPTHRAIAMIAGGPGQSVVDFASAVADGAFEKELVPLRVDYDEVLVDDRGMGGSNASHCDFAPVSNPASYFTQLWPDKLVTECRDRYAAIANPNFYNTSNAVDDLDELRGALGYPKIVLDGGSYGTFLSLVFLRRHPQHAESAILDSVAPPHFQPLPGEPGGAQIVLDDLVTKCRNDAACNARFPKFEAHFAALVARFDSGPVPVRVKNPVTKRFERVRLSKEVFVEAIRHILYDPDSAAYVPFAIERAYAGDTDPLARMIDDVSVEFDHELDEGAFLSYTCADQIPFVPEEALKAAARHSFAADLRVRAQQHACSIWNVAAMPASFNDIVRSDVPVLMIGGSDDPGTPIRYAELQLHYLSDAKLVIVKGGGHSTETPCTDDLIVTFVRAQSAKKLDVSSCQAKPFPLPPFKTSMSGWGDD